MASWKGTKQLGAALVTALAILQPVPGAAQQMGGMEAPRATESPSLTYGGSADFYYSTNFNDPFTGRSALRAWDVKDEHGPHLGLIDLWLQQRRDPVGLRLDLNFGPTAHLFHAMEPSNSEVWQHVQQAYASVNLHRNGRTYVEVGKWVSPAGVEMAEPRDNWLYSRGLLFTWAMPFYHAGARFYHYFNDMEYLMVHVNRGWNAVGNPHHGPGFGITGSKMVSPRWMLMGNYFGGDEPEMMDDMGGMPEGTMRRLQPRRRISGTPGMGMRNRQRNSYRHLLDLVATQMPGGRWSFTHNLDVGHQSGDSWYGLSSQARYTLNAKHYLALRGEILRDEGGMMTGADQTVGSVTLGYGYTFSRHAHARLEYRHDFAGGNHPFADEQRGRFRSAQDTLLVATIFSY
jgi:hypothetical protein